MLTRLGNKRKIMKDLYPLFPSHKMRVELFFGAGGSFFNLPAPKYSILNDLDDDVTNLYLMVLNQKEVLLNALRLMPISSSLLVYWKNHFETDPLKKALRFLLISNFTYMGKGDMLRIGLDNSKKLMIESIDSIFLQLQNAKILSCDFREVLSKVSYSNVLSKEQTFVYMDPCYLDKCNNYKVPSWSEQDTKDCFEIMANSGVNCAMSEFSHACVLDYASDYNMFVTNVKTRTSLKNTNTEVLFTNYDTQKQSVLF